MWKTLKTAVNLPRSERSGKFTPRSDCAGLREIAKKPRDASQNMAAQLRFAKLNLNKQDFSINVLWTDETKGEMIGEIQTQHVGTNTAEEA